MTIKIKDLKRITAAEAENADLFIVQDVSLGSDGQSKTMTASEVAKLVETAGAIEHSATLNLQADDHLQYHTEGRADTWLGTKTTADLTEGTNEYHTTVRAQDAVGTILTDSTEIDFTYNETTPSITANIQAGSVSADKLDAGINTILDNALVAGQPIDADDVQIDNGSFEVLVNSNTQTLMKEIDTNLERTQGTEVKGGTGAVTFTVGETTFNVAATQGQIKDETGYYPIDFAGEVNISVSNPSVTNTWVYIDKNSTVQQQNTKPTCAEFRSKLFLTRLGSIGGTLAAQEETSNPSGQYTNSLRDYLSYITSPKRGLNISGNTDLTFTVAAGSIFELGIQNATNSDNPNETMFDVVNPAPFLRFTRDSVTPGFVTDINVTEYDNNGVLTTLTNNRFKIITVYKFSSGNQAIQEGQEQYSTLDSAQEAIFTRSYVNNPSLVGGTRIGWIIVQKNATDLTDISTSRIIQDTGNTNSSTGVSGALLASNNLSDLESVTTATTNLGLGDLASANASLILEAEGIANNDNDNTVPTSAAVKDYVDNSGSATDNIGKIAPFATSTVPANWIRCDGQAISRITYPSLFTALGTTYGAGNGSTTFNVPDLRGRSVFGLDGGSGRLTAATSLGDSGGAAVHTLTEAEMPAHRHTYNAQDTTSGGGGGYNLSRLGENAGSNITGFGDGSINLTGGDAAHNNMPPYLGLTWYIRGDTLVADPLDPSNPVSFGTLATLNDITINQINSETLVSAVGGIENNDNDTTIPTSAAVVDYVQTNGSDPRQLTTAWVNFDATGTLSIRDSFNISGIVDNGVGDYSPIFESPMDRDDYIVTGSVVGDLADTGGFFSFITSNVSSVANTVNGFRFGVRTDGGGARDKSTVGITVFGGK